MVEGEANEIQEEEMLEAEMQFWVMKEIIKHCQVSDRDWTQH